VDPEYYLTLLQTSTSARLASRVKTTADDAEESAFRAALERNEDSESDDAVELSVFQEMKREDELREWENNIRNVYVAAEHIDLAANPPVCPQGVPHELLSLWSLAPKERHEYYAFLIKQCIYTKVRDLLKILDVMEAVIALRNHALAEVKLEILQGADVIGLTTTGCALNQELIRSLRPSVLVVEEAAEVLESQLLACMTDSLKQLILIGDHYQLKPRVETYAYEKFNKLNVSMFERLTNTLKPIRLVQQRRMHPSISRLIRPFYDEQPLEDHASVLSRLFISSSGHRVQDVPGLGKCARLFMWTHSHPEECAPNSRSKINTLEIKMVLNLVNHLCQQGVPQCSITVITPYLGQCRALRSVLRSNAASSLTLRDVRVSTVDLYQGDENDVIIVSMVRTQRLTDFLKMRNRMIVTCSRARHAMVIIADNTLLQQSPHWREVVNALEETRSIGDRIPVRFGDKEVLVLNKDQWPQISST
jgi:hypothetical protein